MKQFRVEIYSRSYSEWPMYSEVHTARTVVSAIRKAFNTSDIRAISGGMVNYSPNAFKDSYDVMTLQGMYLTKVVLL